MVNHEILKIITYKRYVQFWLFFFFIIQIAYTVPDKESMCIFMFPMIGKWNLMV